MSRENLSQDSLIEATRRRARFSGHGNAKGAAGYVSDTDNNAYNFLGVTGQTDIFNPQENGYEKIRIGAAWNNVLVEESGFFGKIFKKVQKKGVDLDLGCLYELQNGKRGCIQAFGDMYGRYKLEPFIHLSGDDRTGDDDDDDDGEDEILRVNGQKWPEIKRLLVYLYIYGGAGNWAQIKPQMQIRIPNEKPMIVTLHTYKSQLAICAVAGLENVRNGIKLTNYTEYYPGHAEMDRAFGFGIEWADGAKS
ncbi:MAG: Tellurium resistance protein TerA [Alphaproteobacteria bacterium CG_4_9_14_3_um_filter_47_13]|nr:MAG: Tellurium resistance protein TerA [Alphaproteobacteria bacterium CG_4_9_14_3_um_filter_47_13]